MKGGWSVKRTVWGKGTISVETRYYIVSFDDFDHAKKSIRAHWSIENGLHWALDVIFGEDACTVKKGYAPQNMNVLRKSSLNIVKKGQEAINSNVSRMVIRQVCNSNIIDIELLVNGNSLSSFLSWQ